MRKGVTRSVPGLRTPKWETAGNRQSPIRTTHTVPAPSSLTPMPRKPAHGKIGQEFHYPLTIEAIFGKRTANGNGGGIWMGLPSALEWPPATDPEECEAVWDS
jgi:hypothetical protein